jgi:hypothetical protein
MIRICMYVCLPRSHSFSHGNIYRKCYTVEYEVILTVSCRANSTVGVKAVRQYPVPSALYVMGILFCLLFNGSSVSDQQYRQYDATISTFDYSKLDDLTGTILVYQIVDF